MANEQIDQDSLAAEWGVALEAEQKAATNVPGDRTTADGEGGSGPEAMASQWANMADDAISVRGRRAAPSAS